MSIGDKVEEAPKERPTFAAGLAIGVSLGLAIGLCLGMVGSHTKGEREAEEARHRAAVLSQQLEQATRALRAAHRENLSYRDLARKYYWNDKEIRGFYEPDDWALLKQLLGEDPQSPAPSP